MTLRITTVLHSVSDLDAAKKLYTALLGIAPQTDTSYYVGFDTADQHLGLIPAKDGVAAPVAYWAVTGIDAKVAELTAAGATVREKPHDVGGGRLIATVTDPDGTVIGLLQDS
ncbi:putative enzyme related to lactoylglutathione lyase [Actinoplanes octamycinicus]|uniref:Putative enzyme related to lactoylglutathione lyase n=1 Tax=Actinoplanes octamycinicus TaxID=135948 RepID=A0A7W7H3U4_9ACTN|nr:VOC family protein [Actinoplanes octamycinicus]MBB4743471.1 putative enzyme related to lactoylglutathione lyase [Actinoplanes octamycinicus]GIE62544.1 glyoxalase [Actinoplanes octamycinicus]